MVFFLLWSYLGNDIQSHALEEILDRDRVVVLGDLLQMVDHVVNTAPQHVQHALDFTRGKCGTQALSKMVYRAVG